MRLAACLFALMTLMSGSPALAVSPWFVFFAPGSVGVEAYGLATLANVVDAWRAANIRQLRIVGHADRAGPADANLILARRRAEAVKAALVQRGFPADAIEIEAWGEARPLVETGDGVAEAQNRRVEIVIERMCAPQFGYHDC